MASLTEISITSRKVIRYGIYLLILILIGRFVFKIGEGIYKKMVPPPKPVANCAFDKLPAVAFPSVEIKPKPLNLNFTLELPEGNLPTFPEIIEVYHMPTFQPDISVVDDAKNKAKSLGFNPDGKVMVENVPNVYRFEKDKAPSNLIMNVITGAFSISYDTSLDPEAIRSSTVSFEEANAYIKSLLKSSKLLADDLDSGTQTFQFLKTQNNTLVPAVSLSEANAIKINLFRKSYGKDEDIVPVTPNMPSANVWFMVGEKRNILQAQYYYYPIDPEKTATYPLITSEKAWEELKNGNAYFANLGENTQNTIIRRVYLAYYDAGQYVEYYQPVVVFEGDNDFYAYIPAALECQ